MPITNRQRRILQAIMSEFMDTAEAVGSLTLADKYDIGVSPATLRSEMATLVKQGFLLKEHSSSGRIPTGIGIRYFIDEMLKEEEPDSLEQTRLKERLFQSRFNRALFIREAVKALSEIAGQVSVSLVDDMVFVSGVGYLLRNPEFSDLDLLQDTLNVIESETLLGKLFSLYRNDSRLKTLIGDEIGLDSLSDCSIVFSPFNYYRGAKGYIGVIGPKRMRYERIIPAVRTISEFIENSIAGWD
ncbi:MAG: hypothetical protein ABIE03_04490 [Patescibacteria group bacterium]|nr:hypothetical protein [Patescibacteria group bacterium]